MQIGFLTVNFCLNFITMLRTTPILSASIANLFFIFIFLLFDAVPILLSLLCYVVWKQLKDTQQLPSGRYTTLPVKAILKNNGNLMPLKAAKPSGLVLLGAHLCSPGSGLVTDLRNSSHPMLLHSILISTVLDKLFSISEAMALSKLILGAHLQLQKQLWFWKTEAKTCSEMHKLK